MKTKELTYKDWKKKYYPIPASAAKYSTLDAAEHSLLKWTGLYPSVLEKYKLYKLSGKIRNLDDKLIIELNDTTCALCKRFKHCDTCPIKEEIGSACSLSFNDPYSYFIKFSDPRPMIKLLRKIIRKESRMLLR